MRYYEDCWWQGPIVLPSAPDVLAEIDRMAQQSVSSKPQDMGDIKGAPSAAKEPGITGPTVG
jgi:hypothetical protein